MARMLFLYDGQNLLATMNVADDGAVRAFDPRGKYLGKFPSVKAVSAAISTPSGKDAAELRRQARHRQQIRALAARHRRMRDKIKKSAA